MKFVWDEKKNKANRASHNISFEEASKLFELGTDYLEIFDEKHSVYEDVVRIISARFATKNEKKIFENYKLRK